MKIREFQDVTCAYQDRRFGLYQGDRFLDEGLLHRENKKGAVKRIYAPVEATTAVDRLPGGLFMGYLSAHYGHFLLESLCRAWASGRPEHGDLPLVWILLHPQMEGRLTKWQRDILGFYGLLDRVHLLGTSTRFDRLLVPEEGYRIKYRFDGEHAAFLGRYPEQAPVPGKKVWLSRSGLKHRRVENELIVEEALTKQGWQVVHPQKLKWVDQLRTLADCEHLAGFAGSGLHTVIALSGFRGALHLFPLGPGFNSNFKTIGDVKQLRQTLHAIDVSKTGVEYQQEAFACGQPERIVDLLSKIT